MFPSSPLLRLLEVLLTWFCQRLKLCNGLHRDLVWGSSQPPALWGPWTSAASCINWGLSRATPASCVSLFPGVCWVLNAATCCGLHTASVFVRAYACSLVLRISHHQSLLCALRSPTLSQILVGPYFWSFSTKQNWNQLISAHSCTCAFECARETGRMTPNAHNHHSGSSHQCRWNLNFPWLGRMG